MGFPSLFFSLAFLRVAVSSEALETANELTFSVELGGVSLPDSRGLEKKIAIRGLRHDWFEASLGLMCDTVRWPDQSSYICMALDTSSHIPVKHPSSRLSRRGPHWASYTSQLRSLDEL